MKETRKQIVEQTRNEVARQYKAEINSIQESKERLSKDYYDLQIKYWDMKNKVDELEEKVRQYEDWNRRLQEFMDMGEDDRKKYAEHLKAQAELNQMLSGTLGTFGQYMSLFSV